MTEQTHAEFWDREERATVCLVSEERATLDQEELIVRTETRWGIRWRHADSRADHLERYPDEKEARVRYTQLRGQQT